MSKNNRQNRERKRQKLAKSKARRASTNRRSPAAKTSPNITVSTASSDKNETASASTAGEVTRADIDRIAHSISRGPLGLVHHRPQPWALSQLCYNNAMEMSSRAGGRVQCGWTFNVRINPEFGRYVFCTPHAVWHDPKDGSLVDVTPHPDPFHAPLMQGGSVLFLVDEAAKPVAVTDNVILSLPIRYFAIGNSPSLADYVTEMNARAISDFNREKRDALINTGR